ncbi:MAG: DEAD/DEAH box helicase [Bacteroidota bacterium]
MLQIIKNKVLQLQKDSILTKVQIRTAHKMAEQQKCIILAQGPNTFYFSVSAEKGPIEFHLEIDESNEIYPIKNEIWQNWDQNYLAALLVLEEYYHTLEIPLETSGKKYTREGMKRRVLAERLDKALKADYKVEFADNIYGEHTLINEKGNKFKVTLHDFEKKTGYIDNIDWRTNKLGTTKHILYVFNVLEADKRLLNQLDKTYPFVEIYTDPLNDYQVTWRGPDALSDELKDMLHTYFGPENYVPDANVKDLLSLLEETQQFDNLVIRPEVYDKIDQAYREQSLKTLAKQTKVDFDLLKVKPFPYQQEGIEFATFKEGAIIADDMGLGKTLQSIGVSVAKKAIFDFTKTLIICPASLKAQWKSEIEKFSNEKAVVVEGPPDERRAIYREFDGYFFITNYEAVLKDSSHINRVGFDFLVLDEAQRIKNFNTKTHSAIRRIAKKHALAITGTPIENKLLDLYSIVTFLKPYFLTPLWEFSYQHCVFDPQQKDKILGYYNLNALKNRMREILIRREKRAVLSELPNIRQQEIPVKLSLYQHELHAGYASGVSQILSKKYKTPYDMQMLMHMLTCMRMVCDSSALVDDKSSDSPKLIELEHILTEKLDMPNTERKIIIFSEWVKMNRLIGQMLRKIGIGFIELNGKVPVSKRGELIKKFEEDPEISVFLSTEAGGTGLNLQVADTVINFEVPWNPAKKNQRIGRIDRLGQKSTHLSVLNLISTNSIEQNIAAGLMLKQNLFEGVLDKGNHTDIVDFSEKGKSQFLQQLEEMLEEMPTEIKAEEHDEPAEIEPQEKLLEDQQLSLTEEISFETTDDPGQEEEVPLKSGDVNTTDEESLTPHDEGNKQKIAAMEEVMNQGMGFLAGLYQISTGKAMKAEDQKIEINKETGEVTMKFKLPGF